MSGGERMTNAQKTNRSEQERLINEFAEQYMEKLFYYCLKKTGDTTEAEDLTSEIMLAVISSLDKGMIPQSFHAWVWRIASNIYSRWAASKHIKTMSETGTDTECLDNLADPDEDLNDIAERYEHDARLVLLRRELAFISWDYRKLLVEYYIKGKSIQCISHSLNLPEGTVKTKLFRARKILKEGMNMAREFGKRSYDPESIGFCASGTQNNGYPWAAVQRKIPVNILCEANNNPSTAEELAVALGVALPYMEEEIKLLEDAELLKKTDGGKYITSFFISPVECQNESKEICCEFAEETYGAIWQLAGKALKKAKELGISTDAYTEEDAQMYFAFKIEQKLGEDRLPKNIFCKFKRRDGSNWGIIGFEKGSSSRLPSVFFNSNGAIKNMTTKWDGFQKGSSKDKTFSVRRYKHDTPECNSLGFLKKIACENGINKNAVGEWGNADWLVEEGFLTESDGGVLKVNAVLIENEKNEALLEYIRSTEDYCRLLEKSKQTVDRVKAVIEKYSNPYLKEDFDYYVAMSLTTREVFARLWADKGLYKGNSAQFCALYY